MIVPWHTLPAETLTRLIEHFVLQEGTEYGEHEVSLATKVAQVTQQLERGEALIVYSELHESVNIVAASSINHMTTDDHIAND